MSGYGCHLRRALLLVLTLVGAVALPGTQVALARQDIDRSRADKLRAEPDPVIVRSIDLRIQGVRVRGWVASVDLASRRVRVHVSDLRNQGTFVPQTTFDWADDNEPTVAINANYFGATAPIGLIISDGNVISPARQTDPVLLVGPGGAWVSSQRVPPLTGVRQAVAGVGRSASSNNNAALVTNGANTGAQSRVAPNSLEPRTAVGVDATGRWLYLVVIDGRQPGWSGGMTLPQLADYMIALGCSDAVNLDGGGSSSFHAQSPGGEIFRNRPSDGAARPVFNHLAVFVSPAVERAPQKGGDVE